MACIQLNRQLSTTANCIQGSNKIGNLTSVWMELIRHKRKKVNHETKTINKRTFTENYTENKKKTQLKYGLKLAPSQNAMSIWLPTPSQSLFTCKPKIDRIHKRKQTNKFIHLNSVTISTNESKRTQIYWKCVLMFVPISWCQFIFVFFLFGSFVYRTIWFLQSQYLLLLLLFFNHATREFLCSPMRQCVRPANPLGTDTMLRERTHHAPHTHTGRQSAGASAIGNITNFGKMPN